MLQLQNTVRPEVSKGEKDFCKRLNTIPKRRPASAEMQYSALECHPKTGKKVPPSETLQPLLNLSFIRSSIQGGSGDNGAGLGASHQTGWTGLVAKMIDLFGRLDPVTFLVGGRRIAFSRSEPSGRDDTVTR